MNTYQVLSDRGVLKINIKLLKDEREFENNCRETKRDYTYDLKYLCFFGERNIQSRDL